MRSLREREIVDDDTCTEAGRRPGALLQPDLLQMQRDSFRRFMQEGVFEAVSEVGLIGNLMKVPPSSELMRLTFEHADRVADENVSWLTLNKILCNYAQLLQLTPYIRKDIVNEGSLADTIVDFAGSRYRAPPPGWYGIHWGNEYWSKQTSNHSERNGEFVTKNSPASGSLLYELYRTHGLIDPRLWEQL